METMRFSFKAASGRIEVDPAKIVFNNSFPVRANILALINVLWFHRFNVKINNFVLGMTC